MHIDIKKYEEYREIKKGIIYLVVVVVYFSSWRCYEELHMP